MCAARLGGELLDYDLLIIGHLSRPQSTIIACRPVEAEDDWICFLLGRKLLHHNWIQTKSKL